MKSMDKNMEIWENYKMNPVLQATRTRQGKFSFKIECHKQVYVTSEIFLNIFYTAPQYEI